MVPTDPRRLPACLTQSARRPVNSAKHPKLTMTLTGPRYLFLTYLPCNAGSFLSRRPDWNNFVGLSLPETADGQRAVRDPIRR